MKQLPVVSVVFIFLFLQTIITAAQTSTKDLPFVKGSVDYYRDGAVSHGKLADPTTIEGYPCTGEVRFHPNGRLAECTVSAAVDVQGIRIPKGSVIGFDETGKLKNCGFSDDVVIQGLKLDGGIFRNTVRFYPNGLLEMGHLEEDAVVQGIPCKRDMDYGLEFHENGKLRKCRLARDMTIEDKNYKKGTELTWDDKGKIVNVETEFEGENFPLFNLIVWLF